MSPAAPSADATDIAGALAWARARIDQMDARVLLRHVLQCPAARLVAWPEHKLAAEDWANYRGLVERRVALHDRRSNAIRLTAAGGVLLKKLKRQVVQHEKRLLQNFSEQEHATFITLLQKVFPEHR